MGGLVSKYKNAGDRNSDVSNSKWVSQALIKGPGAVYVQNGSPVTFACEISPLSSQAGTYGLFLPRSPWSGGCTRERKFPRRLTEDRFQRNNISVETEYKEGDQRILSKIHLPTVSWRDSGQYTCMQPSTKPDSVKLIVVEDISHLVFEAGRV
ncbi:hypothetical protein NQ318_006901 [Aromia moschata]|uniref:Immunoglobulin domain-containing protein n=1 Tax=Aromia moschata TaxID=1265417 RepID=A0AAV8XM95_9CUCU|nr:hypothetical protein NQ318_006901 [Aromia moschata]